MAAIEKPLKTLAVKENKIISIISTRSNNERKQHKAHKEQH